jgi:hypothetical protein
LAWVRERYAWPIRLAPGSTPWVKANAVTPAIESSSAEIVVIADADVWTDGITDAIEAVQQGAPWAIPHLNVHRLTENGTAAVLGDAEWNAQQLDRRPYRGYEGGGVTVLRRDDYLDVPMDPRFTGWGQEDASWGYALRCLLGEPWRGTAPLIHLWHPPQARMTNKYGSPGGKQLWKRYLLARRRPDEMRKLVKEFSDPSPATQPNSDDHPALGLRDAR